LDRLILEENWNGNQPKITQKRDKDSLVQYPNILSHLRGVYMQEEREGDPSFLPKTVTQQPWL
jgi:hypothetical protein